MLPVRGNDPTQSECVVGDPGARDDDDGGFEERWAIFCLTTQGVSTVAVGTRHSHTNLDAYITTGGDPNLYGATVEIFAKVQNGRSLIATATLSAVAAVAAQTQKVSASGAASDGFDVEVTTFAATAANSQITAIAYGYEGSCCTGGGGGDGITSLIDNVLAGPGVSPVPAITVDILIPAVDASVAVGLFTSTVFFSGLTATRTATLSANPTLGQRVTVKDADGSLATEDFVIAGGGHDIDQAASYTMTNTKNGPRGSLTLVFAGTIGWLIV